MVLTVEVFPRRSLPVVVVPEELLAALVAGDHDGTGGGHLEQSRGETREEGPDSLLRHQLPGDGGVTAGQAGLDSHDVLLPHLDLLQGLDHVEGESDGAGHTPRHGPAEEGDEEVVVERNEDVSSVGVGGQEVFGLLVERPVEGREGNISEEGCRVAVPETSHSLALDKQGEALPDVRPGHLLGLHLGPDQLQRVDDGDGQESGQSSCCEGDPACRGE